MSSLPSLPSTAPVSLATSMDGHCVPGLIEGQEFESVQRSGLFGKLLSVDRESVTSMARSMRSNATYRSAGYSISASSYKDGSGKDRDVGVAPPQQASWVAIAFIMISEVVGAGVLTLSQKYAELGYVPASLLILANFFLLYYTAWQMVEVKKVFLAAVSISDAMDYTFGRVLRTTCHVILLINLTFVLGDYLLLIGKSLGSTIYNIHLCSPIWTLIGSAIAGSLLCSLRYLHSTTALCVVSVLTISGSVGIVIVALVVNGRAADVESPIFAEGLDFMQFMQSQSAIYFTFSGQFMFFELMSEMKDFTEFTKTFRIAGPFQVSIYLLVGCVGYYYKGTEASGYFLDNLGFGPAYRVASALLCFHIIVGFVIVGNVLCRILHIQFSPFRANDLSWRGRLEWAAVGFGVTATSFVIANAIPFFDLLTGLIGGLLLPPLCLLAPVVLYIKTRHMVKSSNLIRVDADELTYPLHIVIRFELEQGLFDGTITCDDLPERWNELYEKYLGLKVPNDKEGVLQDVHWGSLAFGYFPSYSLGAMYACQFFAEAERAIPRLRGQIREGNFEPLRAWLTENIHSKGSLYPSADELCEAVTGKKLDPKIYLEFLREKYRKLYKIQ